MDLSNRVSSKKHVDFNDARYQLSEKLRPAANRNMRNSFTLYDDKGANKVSVNDISAAYALSDKKIPIGELLNKMMDLILDLQDGVLDSSEDAVYSWKFSQVLVRIFDDRIKHGETIASFDNSLKNSVITSKVFNERYPNKYTLRTNFYDKKVLAELLKDVVSTFREDTIPKIHTAAITQSKETAETHHNEVLDRIAQWAVENYDCQAESFYEINEDPDTGLMYATNVVLLRMKNGYDLSLLGYVGTEHDHQFCIARFNAKTTELDSSKQNILQEDVKKQLMESVDKDPVEPITRLIRKEVKKEEVYKEQIRILSEIRPMIKEDILKLKAAESIVGKDYIWGCENYRLTHKDLPDDFKLADVTLPEFDEIAFENEEDAMEQLSQVVANANENSATEEQPTIESSVKPLVEKPVTPTTKEDSDKTEPTKAEEIDTMATFYSAPDKKEDPKSLDAILPKKQEYVHKDINNHDEKKEPEFKRASTLLPGLRPEVKKDETPKAQSITSNAKKMPSKSEQEEKIKTSTLLPSQKAKLSKEKDSVEEKVEPVIETPPTEIENNQPIETPVEETKKPADQLNIADLFK